MSVAIVANCLYAGKNGHAIFSIISIRILLDLFWSCIFCLPSSDFEQPSKWISRGRKYATTY